MIKIDGDRFYMTLGDACYLLRMRGGVLERVCFGKRVEPEDDIPALGSSAAEELCPNDLYIYRGGKRLSAALALVGASVCAKPDVPDTPVLRGEKTLRLELEDIRAGVGVTLFYTPYMRGGIARSVVITNLSSAPLTVRGIDVGFPARGKKSALPGGLTAVNTAHGCYGFSYICFSATNGEDYECVLGKGESYRAPELLAVYSERGTDGATRVFHDILREYAPYASAAGRPPIVLYCPETAEKDLAVRIDGAAEMGIDTFAVGFDMLASFKNVRAAADAVRAKGMGFGIACGNAMSVRDIAAVSKLDALIAETAARYVEFYFDGQGSYSDACALWSVCNALKCKYPELIIGYASTPETGGALERLHMRAHTPLPLVCRRNAVRAGGASLKTEFDIATFGGLGYALDPAELPAALRRAIRAQVFSYQDDAGLIANGDIYLIGNGIMVVSKDKSKAYAAAAGDVMLAGLDEQNLYHVRELGKTFSGAALKYYGISAGGADGETTTYHITQVADYEQ